MDSSYCRFASWGSFLLQSYTWGIYNSSNSALHGRRALFELLWRGMTFLAAEISGSLLAFVANEGGVLTSSDYGSTLVQTSAPTSLWDAITVEITGRDLAGVQASGGRRV